MDKYKNNFILILSQVSFLSYISDSYVEHNFSEAVQLTARFLFLLFWFIPFFLSFTYVKHLSIAKHYYSILGLTLFLTILGIINGQRPHDSFYVFCKLFTYLHVFLYLSTCSPTSNVRLLVKITFYSALVYITFNYINIYRSGNSFYTLGLIQLPLFIFSILVASIFNKRFGFFLLLVIFFINICVIYQGALVEVENDSLRIQYLPVGLSILILLCFFLIWLVRSANLYYFLALSLIAVFGIYFEEISLFFQFENRRTSYLERLYIFAFMASDSFLFTLPQGLGSSLKQYDLSKLPFIGERVFYPPHSGVAVILYEFSIFGVIFLIYHISKILETTISGNIPSSNSSRRALSSTTLLDLQLNYSRFTLNQLKLLGWLVFSIWLIHNLLYLKGVITADTFSDDGIIIYMLLYLIVRQSIVKK
jgi:hypothetical protein